MYYPYLRGKQFELIALRESIEFLKSGTIVPIIEPVKNTTSVLKKTLDVFRKNNIKSWLVLNPQVGELVANRLVLLELITDNIIDPAIIITSQTSLEMFDGIISTMKDDRAFNIIIQSLCDDETMQNILSHTNIDNIVVDSSIKNRRLLRLSSSINGKMISLNDFFASKSRNKDYLEIEQEFFSDEYKYYSDEGYIGFSDYLTIGRDYSESGFLPYAVAIHLTYLNGGDIHIAHFVSDSNDDNSDTAGKYLEAVSKLVGFVADNDIEHTKAIKAFIDLRARMQYPGLGILKKLSIMNHIELVSKLLSGE